METRLRVLNWILAVGETSVAKPPVIAEAKQDDSDTASVVEEEGVRPKLTLQHPNFGSMPFEEPIERVDLDQILISLHEIDEVKKLFASRRTALYPTARIALSSVSLNCNAFSVFFMS